VRKIKENAPLDMRDKKIRKAVLYVRRNIGYELRLSDIADHACVTPSYLSRYFKAKTGHNISKWIADTRLDAATLLLESTDLPISSIALETGFANARTFRRLFSDRFAMSAREYRLSMDAR